jgi:hypothetical protein
MDITLTKEEANQLGWAEGIELELKIENSELIVTKKEVKEG